MKENFPIEKIKEFKTPFYFYDTALLRKTLATVKAESEKYGYRIHYAIKANSNSKILKIIASCGLGADCVSGNEVKHAIETGFPASKIVFAGVGKTDDEINLALDYDIFCFNAESIPELEIINELAAAKNKKANIALRINPNVDAHTHQHITTGLDENKFGINWYDVAEVAKLAGRLNHLNLTGIHFHIGSQITQFSSFQKLCSRINEIQDILEKEGILLKHINIGGGLGVNYEEPDRFPIPDFESYFRLLNQNLRLREGQTLHAEPGRSIVAQCGSLITKVTYVKIGKQKKFAIVDAGMTDLIRPALYDAYHHIENITSTGEEDIYDLVGPICESADIFRKNVLMNETKRGDLIAIRSAGAYGEVMVSRYNLRELPETYLSEEIE